MPYVVQEHRTGEHGFAARGAAVELWKYRGPECLMAGPAETGKTFACCVKLNSLLWNYPGAQAAMIRKEYRAVIGSAMQTYLKIIGRDSPIKSFGGEKPEWFQYPNKSRLWVGGLDNAGKVLSSERDFVFVNQTEELTLDEWSILTSRATGRAGHAPYSQIFGDCNPSHGQHWILHREGLKVFHSKHVDNPALWDAEKGAWTEQGLKTIEVLDRLPGVLRERLRHGRWVSAEGTVYSLDPRTHVLSLADLQKAGVAA